MSTRLRSLGLVAAAVVAASLLVGQLIDDRDDRLSPAPAASRPATATVDPAAEPSPDEAATERSVTAAEDALLVAGHRCVVTTAGRAVATFVVPEDVVTTDCRALHLAEKFEPECDCEPAVTVAVLPRLLFEALDDANPHTTPDEYPSPTLRPAWASPHEPPPDDVDGRTPEPARAWTLDWTSDAVRHRTRLISLGDDRAAILSVDGTHALSDQMHVLRHAAFDAVLRTLAVSPLSDVTLPVRASDCADVLNGAGPADWWTDRECRHFSTSTENGACDCLGPIIVTDWVTSPPDDLVPGAVTGRGAISDDRTVTVMAGTWNRGDDEIPVEVMRADQDGLSRYVIAVRDPEHAAPGHRWADTVMMQRTIIERSTFDKPVECRGEATDWPDARQQWVLDVDADRVADLVSVRNNHDGAELVAIARTGVWRGAFDDQIVGMRMTDRQTVLAEVAAGADGEQRHILLRPDRCRIIAAATLVSVVNDGRDRGWCLDGNRLRQWDAELDPGTGALISVEASTHVLIESGELRPARPSEQIWCGRFTSPAEALLARTNEWLDLFAEPEARNARVVQERPGSWARARLQDSHLLTLSASWPAGSAELSGSVVEVTDDRLTVAGTLQLEDPERNAGFACSVDDTFELVRTGADSASDSGWQLRLPDCGSGSAELPVLTFVRPEPGE